MPILQAHNICYQFENGEILFQGISCSINHKRVGLVGLNGAGKSILAAILGGDKNPSNGNVTRPKSIALYRQQASILFSNEFSIAQFLGKDDVLKALGKIEQGDSSQRHFDLIADQWNLPALLAQQLQEIGLPTELDFPCTQLSGGQLARLQLWQLFEKDVELLILDEPSNHLDCEGKKWLINSMQTFKGSILLISHDRELLQNTDEIWELSGLGLKSFGGNFDAYTQQKRTELRALDRQIAVVDSEKKHLKRQTQKNQEKAQQRTAQGNILRKEGSQSKVLLDFKKDKASARASNRLKGELSRLSHLHQKEQSLCAKKEQVKAQTLYLASNQNRSRQVLSINKGVLHLGNTQTIAMRVYSNDKLHLKGRNGVGKSTLLKTLLGKMSLQLGELKVNTPLYYLDQHFGTIRTDLSMLDNLLNQCSDMTERDARTLLAGIGFRRDSVFRLGRLLSGGEKMKLAMLIVSHQPKQPMLLLDEPDNHLDLDSKKMLANALSNYRGGFILVSHDHNFAAEAGVNRTFILKAD